MSRPHEHTGPWAALVDAFGGVERAAEELGVHVATFRRWAAGTVPRSVLTQRAINAVAKKKKIDPLPFPEVE